MLTVRKCGVNKNGRETVSSYVYDIMVDDYIINRLDIFSIELFQIFVTIYKLCLYTTASYFLFRVES